MPRVTLTPGPRQVTDIPKPEFATTSFPTPMQHLDTPSPTQPTKGGVNGRNRAGEHMHCKEHRILLRTLSILEFHFKSMHMPSRMGPTPKSLAAQFAFNSTGTEDTTYVCILIPSPIKEDTRVEAGATEGVGTLVDTLGTATTLVGIMDSTEIPASVIEDSATLVDITEAMGSSRAITRTKRICPLRLRAKDVANRDTESCRHTEGSRI